MSWTVVDAPNKTVLYVLVLLALSASTVLVNEWMATSICWSSGCEVVRDCMSKLGALMTLNIPTEAYLPPILMIS